MKTEGKKEKIRKVCGTGNWNAQETRLQPWQEVVGTYEALEFGEDNVILTLSRTCKNLKITFVNSSAEAQKLTHALIDTAKGTKIVLLKTDDPQKPLLMRVLTQP